MTKNTVHTHDNKIHRGVLQDSDDHLVLAEILFSKQEIIKKRSATENTI